MVVKRLLPHLARQVDVVRLFVDEARLTVRLKHPRIARVMDLGSHAGDVFLALEYVPGVDLVALSRGLEKHNAAPLPVGAVTRIGIDVAEGLYHAHTATDRMGLPLGIVHRDVSPQNVIVTSEGDVKLIDFGIAKAAQRLTITRPGSMRGKVAYASPEQVVGGDVDPRADQFSLGIVLWELLTWRRLFRRPTDIETMKAVVEDDPPSLAILRPQTPIEIVRVIERALAKDPAARFPTCREMALALERAAGTHAVDVSRPMLGALVKTATTETPGPAGSTTP